MKKGSYQVISLQNINFGNAGGDYKEAVKVVGIYDKIEGTKKAILVSGIRFNGTPYPTGFYAVTLESQAYRIIIATRYDSETKKTIKTTIVIQPSDVVQIVEAE